MSQPIYQYDAILPHVSKPMVCLLFEQDRWWLPRFQDRVRHFWQGVEHVNAGMRDHFGLEVTTLRCYQTAFNSTTGETIRVYEFENRSPAWSPPGRGRWVTRDALEALPFGNPGQKAILVNWFDEVEHGIPARRRAWARRGWLDATRNWIRDQLRMQGITLQSVEQVRTWERSCVLRARTNAGNFYLKALPPVFAAEVTLTSALAAWYPRNFPTVVAFDPARRLLLSRDFGGRSLDAIPDPAIWEVALRRLAEIQIGLALRQEELRALGVPFHPLEDLPQDLANLLEDPQVLKGGGIERDDLARLGRRLPGIATLRDELAAIGIPLTLEHGDLWPGNIIWTDEATPLYFDWSDAAVTHPFFSLVLFLDAAQTTFAGAPAVIDRLRDAYLAPWALYKTEEDLRRAVTIARVLGPLHHAITYHQTILPKLEQRWEMEQMLPFYLNIALVGFGDIPTVVSHPTIAPIQPMTPIAWSTIGTPAPPPPPAAAPIDDPLATKVIPKIRLDP